MLELLQSLLSGCVLVHKLAIEIGTKAYQNKMASDQGGERKIEVIRGQSFECGPRYTNLAYIGEGAYGMVV